MRYLYFDTQAGLTDPKLMYETVYDSLLNAPNGYEGMAEARIIGKVFDKLEVIGIPAKRNNQDTFELKAVPTEPFVALEDAEYDLMSRSLRTIRWTGVFARKALQMFDWLEKAPTSKREEVVAEAKQA